MEIGTHECEVARGAHEEADLRRQHFDCAKNPGHSGFIPVHRFSKRHLPLEYRDKNVLRCLRAQAALTVRLCVRHTSSARPTSYPDTGRGHDLYQACYGSKIGQPYPFVGPELREMSRVGTGCVWAVDRISPEEGVICPCPACRLSSQAARGRVWIRTARHLVFDTAEAEATEAECFYDAETISCVKSVKVLYGEKAIFGTVEGDDCVMTCLTHDVELLDKLETAGHQRTLYGWQVHKKTKIKAAVRPTGSASSPLALVTSHPHGRPKMVSVGEVVSSWAVGDLEMTTVWTYNADTCPGSSGAPVWRVGSEGWGCHPHSEALRSGVNRSAEGWW